MTTNQILRVLIAAGPLPAYELARRFGVKAEEVYGPLIAAEARGLVRVNSGHTSSQRTWEAMQEAA